MTEDMADIVERADERFRKQAVTKSGRHDLNDVIRDLGEDPAEVRERAAEDDRRLGCAIRTFLEANYGCKHEYDPDCPGEAEEAAEIVRIMRSFEVKR